MLEPFWIVRMLPERLLQQVEKPARYVGGEWNQVVKPAAAIRVAVCYPDVYEVGMSHQGLRILYEVVNRRPGAAAERVFLPWTDAMALMRRDGVSLCGLESGTPLDQFDLVGITLQHELTFTNVLAMLDLGGIPLRSADREGAHPLVVGGGPCALNPEPVADFFDLLVIGDGEEALDELLDLMLAQPAELMDRGRRTRRQREELLARIASLAGVYVPSGYDLEPTGTGQVVPEPRDERFPERVTRRVVLDLDALPYPLAPVVPYCETVHDRAEIEITRGCTRGCRFCQAGMVYRPVRERSPELLLEQAEQILANTGYDEVSLLSLNCPDYSKITELVHGLNARLVDRHISIGLPSLRVDTFSVELAEQVQRVRKSGLTLAPEAGTQRLRDIINKCVTGDDLLQAARAAFRSGWQRLKLYFMIGLPLETDEDVAGIVGLIDAVRQVAREELGKSARGRFRLSVSVNAFIPKPHTPFQWAGQDTVAELARKRDIIRDGVSDRRVLLSFSNVEQSQLEAALARGDRRLGPMIESAYRAGAVFDSWSECFKAEIWRNAFAEHGLDVAGEATRQIPTDARLPWDVIDAGVSRSFLLAELERAREGAATRDCRTAGCQGCGVAAISGGCPVVSGAGEGV